MTIARLLPFDVHGALEVTLATLLMAGPFFFGFAVPATVVSVTVGALILAVALATHAGEASNITLWTHAAFDVGFPFVLALGAIAVAITGDVAAGLFLAAAALALTLVNAFTRY